MKRHCLLPITCVLLCALAPPVAQAQDVAAGSDGWRQSLVIYLLGPRIEGDVGIGPLDGDVDISPGDVFDSLDGAFLGIYAAEKGRWGIMLDGNYMDLSADASGPGGQLTGELQLKQTVFAAMGTYRLAESWQLLFGGSYVDLTNKLNLRGPLNDRYFRVSESWVDPAVGLRYSTPFGNGWSFGAMGTIGGFGVGSDFMWTATVSVGYDFSERWGMLAGYRYLDFDYENGSGLDRFKFDVAEHGPAVGVRFNF